MVRSFASTNWLQVGLAWEQRWTEQHWIEPGHERYNCGGGQGIGVVAIQVQSMAGATSFVATAAGEWGCLETKGKAELSVGLMGADAFCGKDRSFSSNTTHEFNGGTDRSDLAGCRLSVLDEGLTSGLNLTLLLVVLLRAGRRLRWKL